MPVTFGTLQSKADFFEPQVLPRGARLDPREPFTLNGMLMVTGGRGGRTIVVRLHIVGKSRDGVWQEINQWVDREGQSGVLSLAYPQGAAAKNATYNDCVLARVVSGDVLPMAFDTTLGSAGYRGDPILEFIQLSVAAAPAVAPGGFGG